MLIDMQDYLLMKAGVMSATMEEANGWEMQKVGHFMGFAMAVSEEESRRANQKVT